MLVNEAIFQLSENEKFIRISHQTKYQQRSSRVNHNSHVTVRGLSYEYFLCTEYIDDIFYRTVGGIVTIHPNDLSSGTSQSRVFIYTTGLGLCIPERSLIFWSNH